MEREEARGSSLAPTRVPMCPEVTEVKLVPHNGPLGTGKGRDRMTLD